MTIPITLDAWIREEAIPFSPDVPASFYAAVDEVMAVLDNAVDVLGFGEAMHGGRDLLLLRNRLFQRLVEAYGFSAIAIESSFPRGRVANAYVAGRGPASFDDVQDAGFSHGFGRIEANRELVEWMREYNAASTRRVELRFYGVDSPTEMYGTDSPRYVLEFALDYLASMDADAAREHREQIAPYLGQDADWENPAALMDPAKSIGLSPAATALRIATEDLLTTLTTRRPEWVAKSGADRHAEAMQHLFVARQLLNYHAALARAWPGRTAHLLAIRDTIMADNLMYVAAREGGRGKVFAFAHNSHLKRGRAQWQLGPDLLAWWPAGAHLDRMLGPRYAVIGTGIAMSEANGIGVPEPGSLEARLTASPGPGRFVPTHRGRGLSAREIAALPIRSASAKNPSYFALTPDSFDDFDALAVLDSTG